MKARIKRIRVLAAVLVITAGASTMTGAEDFNETLKREAADYTNRLRQAAEELNHTRDRIAREKAPMLAELRATEDRVIALEHETSRLSTGQEESGTEKRRLLHEISELRRNHAYLTTLAGDGLKTVGDSLAPGEDPFVGGRLQELQQQLDEAAGGAGGPVAMDAAMFLLERTRRVLGGNFAVGHAMNTVNNEMVAGTFAFAGPEVFFRPASGGSAGAVRVREGSRQPVYYPLAKWGATDAAAFFEGRTGLIIADASGGKAMRLEQNHGTVLDHVNKGGKVAYAIIVVGFVALLLILQKTYDVFRFAADSPARVAGVLKAVGTNARAKAQAALAGLRPVTRELFEVGMRNLDEPREILEERLESTLLAQRLQLERRLPLLAVIATAAPLMGLLGTVVGMVRTFSLITVFGTGNAGRLSSGISEVLVATELGLTVAIPTLVIHGFLANRAHKHLSLQEQHALEFVTAVEVSRSNKGRERTAEGVGA